MELTQIVVVAAVLALTLGVTYWAGKRTSSASDFFTAGGSISAKQNGLAIAGDYLSAATFLGFSGLIFLYGADPIIVMLAALVGLLPLLVLLAERMRNLGRFTVGDVLSFRLKKRPARVVAAVGTLSVVVAYLVAQFVGAGVLIQALTGLSFLPAVLITGVLVMIYVGVGGMLATTWIQIIKAILLMITVVAVSLGALISFGFDPLQLFSAAQSDAGIDVPFLGPGGQYDSGLQLASFAAAYLLGAAGLPHLLIRFFTVNDGPAARKSIGWTLACAALVYTGVIFIGMAARAMFSSEQSDQVGPGANLVVPVLSEVLGGGSGTFTGDTAAALATAIALAVILAVVAGLVISASGAVAHDLWGNLKKQGVVDEREQLRVARISTVAIGVITIAMAVFAQNINVGVLIGMAFSIAASSNLPILVMTLFWRNFTTAGAITGVSTGVISTLFFIAMSPKLWDNSSPLGAFALEIPALYCVPLGFLGCWIGSKLGPKDPAAAEKFEELRVRAETAFIPAEERLAI